MKKLIAVVLTLAAVLTFASCQKKVQPESGESTTEVTTATPGAWKTDVNGEIMTTGIVYLLPDENSQPMTEIVTDENGSQYSQLVTTVIYDIWTNPGATKPETVPAGNTMADLQKTWPTEEFMAKVPVLTQTLSDADISKTESGNLAILYINELSYKEFLAYLEECKAAGFAQSAGHAQMPETEKSGETYMYYSEANGLYLNILYNTDTAPYRNCDVKIIVSDYDLLAE